MTEGGSDSFQFSIQGTLTDLQHLHQNCNIAEIKRLFKIPDAIETNKTADDSAVGYVITRISSKDVLKK